MNQENGQGTLGRGVEITQKQADVLEFVENYWLERYCAPTYKEIAQNLGVKSVGWVHSLVNELVSKGILVKKGHRTLRPVHLTQKSLDKKLWRGV